MCNVGQAGINTVTCDGLSARAGQKWPVWWVQTVSAVSKWWEPAHEQSSQHHQLQPPLGRDFYLQHSPCMLSSVFSKVIEVCDNVDYLFEANIKEDMPWLCMRCESGGGGCGRSLAWGINNLSHLQSTTPICHSELCWEYSLLIREHIFD